MWWSFLLPNRTAFPCVCIRYTSFVPKRWAWTRVRAVGLDGVFYGFKFKLPAMVAAMPVFLFSDAASFVSGRYHLVDGGYSAH